MMERYIKAKPYLITERKKTQPKPSRLALYGRLIEHYGKSKANTYKRDVYDWLITRMQREENNL